MLNARALAVATIVGAMLQVTMVVLGHSNTSIASLFAVGGMGISLVAGLLYAWRSRGGSAARVALGGLIAGGACAFLGILVSYVLGDVPPSLLLLGILSSIVTGAIGAWLGKFLARTAQRQGA